MDRTHGVRRLGSAAVDLAYVAAGRFEGFFEFNLNSYDVAAGILLVREAGGHVTQFLEDGDPLFGREVVASNGHMHAAMQATMGEFWLPEPYRPGKLLFLQSRVFLMLASVILNIS